MTERARQVLADCKFAWSKLEDCFAEQEFRILWIAAVALVRLVGDALEKVDSKSDNSLDSAIKEAFQSRQKDAPIYRKFIKFERDQLVHRYDTKSH